jgi:hypothetical protein
VHIPVALDLGPGEQFGAHLPGQWERGWVEAVRRDRTEIDDFGAIRTRLVGDHKADAAKAAVPRLDSGQRKSRRDHSVDRTAARLQRLGADLGGGAVL